MYQSYSMSPLLHRRESLKHLLCGRKFEIYIASIHLRSTNASTGEGTVSAHRSRCSHTPFPSSFRDINCLTGCGSIEFQESSTRFSSGWRRLPTALCYKVLTIWCRGTIGDECLHSLPSILYQIQGLTTLLPRISIPSCRGECAWWRSCISCLKKAWCDRRIIQTQFDIITWNICISLDSLIPVHKPFYSPPHPFTGTFSLLPE